MIVAFSEDARTEYTPVLTSGNIESMRLYKDQVSARLLPKPFSIQFLHALIEQEIKIWEMSVCGFFINLIIGIIWRYV